MTTISARSILASRHAITGKRVDTLLCHYPRWIHAEGRTRRVLRIGEEDVFEDARAPSLMEDPNLSRDASSSRAIPVSKMIEDILTDPAIPLFWGANQKGMQATKENDAHVVAPVPMQYMDRLVLEGRSLTNVEAWLKARDLAVRSAKAGYHKQIVNRLLEPFSHISVVVTATEWSNFFAVRDQKDAEPHIRMLAQAIRGAMHVADVQSIAPGEWHLPFATAPHRRPGSAKGELSDQLKLSVACCASTSYKTVEGFDMTLGRAIDLHDKLVGSTPLHASPCEHQCFADDIGCGPMEGSDWTYVHPKLHGNLKGFAQYRKTLAAENL